jgi:predicted MFS family arabinose efflux permease
MTTDTQSSMGGRWALPFLGLACAVGVGSIYYNQPLLLEMAHTFGVTPREIGFVAVATQVGYACGLLTIVPMGDMAERRSLMMKLYAAVAVALLLAAFATSLGWMIAASVLIGLLASVTHIALPIAPDLVPPEKRGQAVGTVMTGLLFGVLLARTFAGWLSHFGGWRTVYFAAAVMNLAFVPILWKIMPKLEPKQALSYGETMKSLGNLFRTEPLLREAGTTGGLAFAAFSCFWTTMAFLLHDSYKLGPGVAGMFGIVGAVGALVAPVAGRMADKHGTRYVITVAGATFTSAVILLWAGQRIPMSVALHVIAMVIGVVVLDLGQQMLQVGNQTRVFGLGADARSRLNTVYMTMYFVGGALGSGLATLAWSRWRWDGVCALQLGLIGLTGLRHLTGYSRTHADARGSGPVELME